MKTLNEAIQEHRDACDGCGFLPPGRVSDACEKEILLSLVAGHDQEIQWLREELEQIKTEIEELRR